MSTTTLHKTQAPNRKTLTSHMAAGAAWHHHCQSLSTFELEIELALRAHAAPPSLAWREAHIAAVVLAARQRQAVAS